MRAHLKNRKKVKKKKIKDKPGVKCHSASVEVKLTNASRNKQFSEEEQEVRHLVQDGDPAGQQSGETLRLANQQPLHFIPSLKSLYTRRQFQEK